MEFGVKAVSDDTICIAGSREESYTIVCNQMESYARDPRSDFGSTSWM